MLSYPKGNTVMALEISVRPYKPGSTVLRSWTGLMSAWRVVDTTPRSVAVTRLDEGWSLLDFCFLGHRSQTTHAPTLLVNWTGQMCSCG